MQQGGDAEDVVVADVRQRALHDALAALQTSVPLERVPRPLTGYAVEHVHLPDPGDRSHFNIFVARDNSAGVFMLACK